jgi:PcRGLX-like protein central beta sandwich domain/PcRGLX-like N-terminal RIFT barrel domain
MGPPEEADKVDRSHGKHRIESMNKTAIILGFTLFLTAGALFAGQAVIRVEEPVGLDRANWPVSLGFPFAKGELRDQSSLVVLAPDNRPVPIQAKVLSRWPDGSVRWAHVLFLADLKRQAVAEWRLEWNTGVKAPAVPAQNRLSVEEKGGKVSIVAADLAVAFTAGGANLIDSVKVKGREMLDPSRKNGFTIKTPDGKAYEAPAGTAVRLTVEEGGPLRAIVRTEGRHLAASGESLFDYSARFFFYAGVPWVEVEYSFTNRESAEWTDIAAMTLTLPLAPNPAPYLGLTSEYKIDKFYEFREPFSIYSGADDFFGVFGGAKIFKADGAELLGMGYESEVRARWWADSSTSEGGLTVSIQEMSQNYPKAVRIAPDRIDIDLYPAGEKKPLAFHQGWQKTQTMLLYFHGGTGLEAGSRDLCFKWQAPVIPWSPYHVESGLLGDLFPYSPKKYPMIERSIRNGFVQYESGIGRGMIDYGDTMGPGTGERGNFTQNNAYDKSWVSYLLFLRSGERRYWQRGRSAALHTADIDIVHHSTRTPVEVGGVRIHGPNHVQYNAEAIAGTSVAPNHEWVEGLIMTYHLTGEERYLKLAEGMAEHILRARQAGWISPGYNAKWNGARNLAWPILLLTMVYDETGSVRYREEAARIVRDLGSIQRENGSFPITIGPYVASAPLHETIAMEALGRYHAVTQDLVARDIYLKCAEYVIDGSRGSQFPDGEMMYITHPDYRSGYTSSAWGGFHFGYVYTGDKKFLEFPYPLIMTQLRQSKFELYSTSFATSEGALSFPLRGILFYLTFADKAGILQDLPAY